MGAKAIQPARYAELLALPDDVIGEIINGELWAMPRPRPRHANVLYRSGSSFENYHGRGGGGGSSGGGPGGWLLLVEPEVHVGDDVAVPDVSGWRRERLPTLPESAHIEIAPDWVMEVLSPRTMRHDRVVKLPMYARWGVEWLWFADPDARTLEVHHLVDGKYVVHAGYGGDGDVCADPFPLATIPLLRWWEA